MTSAERPSTDRPQNLCILGATGSIGDSVADIVSGNADRFTVSTVVAHTSVEKLAERAVKLGAKRAVIGDESLQGALASRLQGTNIETAAGRQAVLDAAREPADIVVSAMVGALGMEPSMAALEAGNTLALANKEALVCAGAVMIDLARRKGVRILPLDSEHNALFQVFEETNRASIDKVTLTASGGPFRSWTSEQIKHAKLSDALNHPNWSMGQKVTIDSASLANKGLEVIEAHHLFALKPDQIDVVVHPQSIIHGMVHYADGSVLAQLGTPDMRTPIAAALAWPQRCEAQQVKRLNLTDLGSLTFEKPDTERFPMLALAYQAMEEGGAYPALFNAANEIAVAAFADNQIAFHEIATIVAITFEQAAKSEALKGSLTSLEAVLAADRAGRGFANAILKQALHRTASYRTASVG